MANAALLEDIEQVKRIKGVLESVKAYLAGEAERMRAAIAAAMALGATAEELKPLSDEVDSTEGLANEIAGAIVATPPAQG